MHNSIVVPYNEKYLSTPYYPRQRRKMKKLVSSLEERGLSPEKKPIKIEGKNSLAVINGVAEQISKKIDGVLERRYVLCFGDGGNIVFNSALLEHMNGDNLEHPLVVADGGTMANLANTLGTADPTVAAGVASHTIPFEKKNLRIRSAKVTIHNVDEEPKTVTIPWTGSFGTKISGDILGAWELRPRRRNPLVNLALSILDVFKETVQKHSDGQPIQGHSITALEKLAFFTFDKKYTDLEGTTFHHQKFESDFGFDALKRILIYSAIGHIPAVSRWVWSLKKEDFEGKCYADLVELAKEVEPETVQNLPLSTDSRYPIIHADGSPIDLEALGMKKDGKADIELSSTDKSIPVARVLH